MKIQVRDAVQTIKHFRLKSFVIIFFFTLISYKLLDFSLLAGKLNYIENYIAICITSIVITFFRERGKKHRSYLFMLLIFSIAISTFIRKEEEYYIKNLLIIYSMFIFYTLADVEYSGAVLGICIAAFPFLLSWIQTFIATNAYLGNRGPLHFTVIGLLLVSVLLEFKNKWPVFVVLTLNTIICAVGSSRTSLLCNLGCMFLLIIMQMNGKLTIRKIATILIIGLLACMIFVYFQNSMMTMLMDKWNTGQISIFSERNLMWTDVLTNIEIWGFSSDYIDIIYHLSNIHNAYIQAYVSFGIVTGILYFFWLLVILLRGIKHRNQTRVRNLLAPFIAMLVLSMFESTFIMDREYPLMGICIILISGQLNREARKER